MTVVFVHGVPETARLWNELRSQLSVPSIAVTLPGFGCGLPNDLSLTKDGYAEWLAEELRRIDGPVDLVGHDWGALLTLRVATAGGVDLRSWTVDVAGVYHRDYVWHAWAMGLTEPLVGEEILAARRASIRDCPDRASQRLRALGVPKTVALDLDASLDEQMSRIMLGLYRSSVPNVSADWGAEASAATDAPGLILIPRDDAREDEERSRDMARRLGARAEPLDGFGHFWMFDTSGRIVRTLQDFWVSAGAN